MYQEPAAAVDCGGLFSPQLKKMIDEGRLGESPGEGFSPTVNCGMRGLDAAPFFTSKSCLSYG